MKQVSDWLRSGGFDLVTVPQNNLFVTAEGTVAQVEHAFSINESIYSVDGRLLRSPDADPRVPDALADTVTAVTGLDSAYSLAAPRTKTPAPPPPTGRRRPLSHSGASQLNAPPPVPFAGTASPCRG